MTAIAIGTAVGGAAVADPFQDGLAAHKRGDLAEAFRLMRIAAESGHARAQLNVGVMYWKGMGVAANAAEAINWFKRSAAQGNGVAQFYLGEAFRLGEGVPVDDAEALRWYRLSAAAPDNSMAAQAAFYAEALSVQIDLNRRR